MQLFDGRGDKFLTLDEIARFFDYDPDFVRARVEAGKLPCFQLGDELLFSQRALEYWVLSLQVNIQPRIADD